MMKNAKTSRRKQLGLTQSETAEMCNIGARFFSELENDKETLQKVFSLIIQFYTEITKSRTAKFTEFTKYPEVQKAFLLTILVSLLSE